MEPVVGWRSWAVIKQRRQLRLRSVVFDTIWPPQEELVAACNHLWVKLALRRLWRGASAHDVPAERCTCGIHATRELETAANFLYLYDDVRQPHLRYRAIGRVSLWGSVVEGEHGWRAQRAYPERIFLPSTDRYGRPTDIDTIIDGLLDYRIPIEIVDDDDTTAVARALRRVKPKRRRHRGAAA